MNNILNVMNASLHVQAQSKPLVNYFEIRMQVKNSTKQSIIVKYRFISA